MCSAHIPPELFTRKVHGLIRTARTRKNRVISTTFILSKWNRFLGKAFSFKTGKKKIGCSLWRDQQGELVPRALREPRRCSFGWRKIQINNSEVVTLIKHWRLPEDAGGWWTESRKPTNLEKKEGLRNTSAEKQSCFSGNWTFCPCKT